MDFLLNSHVGETYKNPDHEKKYFVPFSRAMEYLRVFGEKKMRIDEPAVSLLFPAGPLWFYMTIELFSSVSWKLQSMKIMNLQTRMGR